MSRPRCRTNLAPRLVLSAHRRGRAACLRRRRAARRAGRRRWRSARPPSPSPRRQRPRRAGAAHRRRAGSARADLHGEARRHADAIALDKASTIASSRPGTTSITQPDSRRPGVAAYRAWQRRPAETGGRTARPRRRQCGRRRPPSCARSPRPALQPRGPARERRQLQVVAEGAEGAVLRAGRARSARWRAPHRRLCRPAAIRRARAAAGPAQRARRASPLPSDRPAKRTASTGPGP